VIGANKYEGLEMPKDTVKEVMGGRDPKLLMDIHDVSGVNDPSIMLSGIDRPASSDDFSKNGK
jgi:NADH-quinone oxidoreductase subunit G